MDYDALPSSDEPGRLLTGRLQPGWPCRWCRRPLSHVLNHASGTATGLVGCACCDLPEGTPA